MATNATINHLAFHGTGYELVNDTLNVTVFSSQGTSESIPSYAKASTTQDGLMSKEDKAKLDDFKTADQYVTIVSGKSLSSNDFTNEYKDKVDSLASNPPTVDTSQFVTDDQLQMAIDEVTVDTSDFVTTNQLQTAVNNVTVDTSQFVTKDGTKVLSTNDYTTADKTKLDGIETGANNFILTKATSSSLGGVKVSGSNGLKMDGEEIKISFYGASGRNTGGNASTLDMSGGVGSTKGGAGGKINMSGYSVLDDTGNHHGGDGGTIFAGGGDATTTSGNAFGGDGGVLILSGGKATGTSGVRQGNGGIIDMSPNGTIKGNVVFIGTPVFNNGIESAKASTTQDGLMSKEDYSKLSSVESGANKYVLSKATSTSLGGVKIVEGNGLYMDGDILKVNIAEAQGDFSLASTTASGLMGSSDKKALESLKAITDATTVESGYMSKEDKIKLAGIDTLYATKSEVSSAVGSVYKAKGSVNSFNDLPSNASVGDVYNIKTAGGTDVNGNSIKAGDNVAKVSNGWDVLAGTIDLSGYATTVLASTSQNGLMSYSDKSKLNSIEAGANKYSLPTATSSSLGGVKVSGHDGLTMDNDTIKIAYGVGLGISSQYNLYLKRATDTEKGGVIITGNDGLTMDGETLKANIPTASQTVKGGVKIGNGLTMSNDTVQVSSPLHLYNSDGSAGTLKLQHRTTYGVGGVLDISAINADAGTVKADGQHGGVIDLTGVHNGGVIIMTGDSGGSIDASGNNYGGVIDLTGRAGSGGSIIASGTDTNSSDHGGLLDLSGYNGGVIDLTGVNSGGSIKGDVIFAGKPHFSQSATGISLQSADVNIPTATYDSIMGNFTLTGNEQSFSSYSLPTASATQKGGIMVGNCLSMSNDSLNVTFSNKTIESSNANLSFPRSTIRSYGSEIGMRGSNIDVSGASIGGGAFQILTPVTLTSSARTTFQGDVIFTGTPTFANGASGIVSSLPTASQTVKGGVKIGKALKMTAESVGVDTLDAEDVYLSTEVVDSLINQLTVSSASSVSSSDFSDIVTMSGGFTIPDSTSSSFGNYDTVTFGSHALINFGNHASIKNGTASELKFMDKVDFQDGFTVANSVRSDFGTNSSLVADNMLVKFTNSNVLLSGATVQGNPTFTNKISFNSGFTTSASVSSNFGSHNTVVADNAYINLTSSEIHVNNADFVGKPDFNSGFSVSDSISTSFGNYDTVTFGNYSKADLKNNSSLIADRSNLTLNNSTMSFKNATVSGNPVFTGTPQFNNGLSSDTVVIPSSVFDSIMEDFVSVASAKSNPTIVFDPTSISKRTDLSEYSLSYTITSDATSHSHYFIDSFEPEDKHQNVTVSGLSGSFTVAPIVSSGTGYHRYYIQVPESTNYKSGTFTYQVDYEDV